MRERVVIKWGGGLITDKSSLCTPDLEILEQLAQTVSDCMRHNLDVVLRSKHWRLNEGFLPHARFNKDEKCMTQREAVNTVRQEMLELNAHVCRALEQKNLTPVIHPPHLWAQNTGPEFSGNLHRFHEQSEGQVHVAFGDVVDVEGEQEFGILSCLL